MAKPPKWQPAPRLPGIVGEEDPGEDQREGTHTEHQVVPLDYCTDGAKELVPLNASLISWSSTRSSAGVCGSCHMSIGPKREMPRSVGTSW